MRNITHIHRVVLALPIAAVMAGGGCTTGMPPEVLPGTGGSIAVVFVNNAKFTVEPTVDGERMPPVLPGRTSRPVLFDCTPGERFAFSGSMRTDTQTLPSPFEITFDEGLNVICGGTIEILFYINANDDLDLESDSYW